MKNGMIKVFQIHYMPEQADCLDPSFLPFDNAASTDPSLEFGVTKQLHQSQIVGDAALWGTVSWKFQQKTGMTGQYLLDYLISHPGYDVYHCNPNPELEALYQNMWMHAQTCHPRFLELVRSVFELGGLDPAVCHFLQPAKAFSSANYTVATPAYWAAYVGFIDRVLQPAMSDAVLREQLLSQRADPANLHRGACYLPFVIERLFGVFLTSAEGRKFRTHKYPLPAAEARLTAHHHRLREMKDVAWTTRSEWLGYCWMGYRNMFLQNQLGADWARRHLAEITPSSIRFDEFEFA